MSDTTRTAPQRLAALACRPTLTWQLHVLASVDARQIGAIHIVHQSGLVIGREPGQAGVDSPDPLLSRRHLKLTVLPRQEGICVTDLQSRNGSWLGGRQIQRATAGDGAVLRAGDWLAVLTSTERDVDAHEADRRGADPASDGPIDVDTAWASSTPEVPGTSPAAVSVRRQIARVAGGSEAVLVHGATGSGKESAADAIHAQSGREGALVRVNIAAIPAQLFESELFGHARGAFSGANATRPGRFVEADGGTLVLDEIGELPMALQPKLLRVLEEGSVRPVGASHDTHIDVRVVASTNANLSDLVSEGRFRPDLAARLKMHSVYLPPLRRRRADLWALCDAILPLTAERPGASSPRVSWATRLETDAAEALLLHPWPNNLRGLKATLLHLSSAPVAPPLPLAALPAWLIDDVRAMVQGAAQPAAVGEVVRLAKVPRPTPEALLHTLETHHGNVGASARALGVHRRQLYRWIAHAGIDAETLQRMRTPDPLAQEPT